MSKPLEHLRVTVSAIATGDLGARANESGPAEISELASAFNQYGDETWRKCSTPVASLSRGQATTSAPHSRRCRQTLEALEDGLAEPDHYLPAMREQVGVLSALVDDLFELARIDAGCAQPRAA